MKLLRYETYPNVKLEVDEFEGQPYLFYEECSTGIRLEATLEDELVEEAKKALEGELPDSLLAVLGIEVFGEDLETVCNELRTRGFDCKFERKDNEEYCESMTLKLSTSGLKLVKVIIENNRVRVRPASSQKSYVAFRTDGRNVVVEAIVPSTLLSVLEGKEDKVKALLGVLVPELKDVEVSDPHEVLEALESSGKDYKFCVERHESLMGWKLE